MGVFLGGLAAGDVRRAMENAVRGVTMDHTGDILFYEDFAGGLAAWELVPAGTGASVDLTMQQRLAPAEFACRMLTGTSGPPAAGASIIKVLSFVQVSPLGMELAFTVNSATLRVTAMLSVVSVAAAATFAIRLNIATGQLQYLDVNSVFQDFSAQGAALTSGLFHRLKFVVDPRSLVYDRVVFDTAPLSNLIGIGAAIGGGAASPYLQAEVDAMDEVGLNAEVDVGRVVLTTSEVL